VKWFPKLYFRSEVFGLEKILHRIKMCKIDENRATLRNKEVRRALSPSCSSSLLPSRNPGPLGKWFKPLDLMLAPI
jgi:hypothetical protein